MSVTAASNGAAGRPRSRRPALVGTHGPGPGGCPRRGPATRRLARTTEERVHDLASATRCPTCRSQSVAESGAPIAREIRTDIARRVEAGESDDQIRDFLVGRFGQDVLLTPPASGVAGLVWVIPVVAVVLAAAGLAVAFWRWRARPRPPPPTPTGRWWTRPSGRERGDRSPPPSRSG